MRVLLLKADEIRFNYPRGEEAARGSTQWDWGAGGDFLCSLCLIRTFWPQIWFHRGWGLWFTVSQAFEWTSGGKKGGQDKFSTEESRTQREIVSWNNFFHYQKLDTFVCFPQPWHHLTRAENSCFVPVCLLYNRVFYKLSNKWDFVSAPCKSCVTKIKFRWSKNDFCSEYFTVLYLGANYVFFPSSEISKINSKRK